jgi:hypothetical protein
MKKFVEKRGVYIEIVKFSDYEYRELFSDEFIKKFDLDFDEWVSFGFSEEDYEDYYLDESVVKMMKDGHASLLLEIDGGLENTYFKFNYNRVDSLKLYDVFDLQYLFIAKDKKKVEILIDKISTDFHLSFLVIHKEYFSGMVWIELIPVICDHTNELQIRLTSGKF